MAVYFSLFEPGDKLMGMKLDQGGHLTHGSPVNFSGRFFEFVSYGVTESDERLDYDQIADLAAQERPRAIIAGATAYSRLWDPEALRRICDDVGALFIFDAAHVAGLIVGGVHPNPVPYADVVTFTTHKTLRGPRGAVIVCKQDYAQAIDKMVMPGIQGGPLDHVIAAKAVAFFEAAQPSFKEYAAQVVRNAQALAQALMCSSDSNFSQAAPQTSQALAQDSQIVTWSGPWRLTTFPATAQISPQSLHSRMLARWSFLPSLTRRAQWWWHESQCSMHWAHALAQSA